MKRPIAKTAFFPCTALGCCGTDQGGCLERAGTLCLCLHPSLFQTLAEGSYLLLQDSAFQGAPRPATVAPSSEAWLWEGLGSGAGLSLSHQI